MILSGPRLHTADHQNHPGYTHPATVPADELYQRCVDEQRQTLNQVMFERLYLDVDDQTPVVAVSVLNPEFATLIELAAFHQPSLNTVVDRELSSRAGQADQRGRFDSRHCGQQTERTPAITDRGSNLTHLAESEGFEPSEACTSTVFETVPFVRSGNSPPVNLAAGRSRSEEGIGQI